MPSPQDVQAAITLITADATLLHNIVNGGPTDTFETENGMVRSVAKVIADLATQISTGYASGYVQSVADNTGRLGAVPAKVGQLLFQLDTKAIYYAPSLVVGSWIYHPVQNAASNAQAAVDAVATLTASLAGKMSASAYVGGSATGVVRTAERILEAVNFLTGNSTSALFIYGVENGATGFFPTATNHRCVDLIDGVSYHSTVYNTSRSSQNIAGGFAFLNSPRRVASWGAQGKTGTLAAGMSGGNAFVPRAVIAMQQPDRALAGFNPGSIYTAAGEIIEMSAQGAATMVMTRDGLILVAGGGTQGVKAIFGSGVDKTQSLLMPIYFDNSGVNAQIKAFDVQDSTDPTYLASTAIFVDTSENIWILSTNKSTAGYGVGVSGPVNTPRKLNSGFPSWDGKLVRKVRCDTTGGIYVLFTNGELWAGGGSNATGMLGTGNTTAILNPLQILTGVSDFEVSGQEQGSTLGLWILQGTTLKAAGYNAHGQMGTPTTNRTSFVTVDTDVNLVRIGGTDTVSVLYRKSTGTWYGIGNNAQGLFGQGATATTNSAPVVLANLVNTISDNGGFVALSISGYGGKHASCVVCTNGKAFCAGNNTDGSLANGTTTNVNTWTEVRWTPRDASEKIIDVSAMTGPSSTPAFAWRTNQGRMLMAGSTTAGFSTGVTPAIPPNVSTGVVTYPIQLVAQPVNFGTL